MKNKRNILIIKNPILILIYVYLILLVVGGNTLTFNLFGRISIKISEILSILIGIALIKSFMSIYWHKSLFFIIVWTILSSVLIIFNSFKYQFNLSDVLTAVLYLFRFVYAIALSYIVFMYLKQKRLLLKTLKFINILYLIVCVIGFLQLVFFPVAFDFYRMFWEIGVYFPDADFHINRIVSTYFDPNYLASCLLIGVTINLYLIQRFSKIKLNKKSTLKYYIMLAVYCLTILLTKSRSGILGLICIVFITVFITADFKNLKLWPVVSFLLGCFILIILFMFSNIDVFVRIRNVFNDDSAFARFSSWDKAIEIISDTDFIGIGYNLFGAYNDKFYGIQFESSGYGNDSSILLILITTGVVGLVLFINHIISLIGKRNIKCITTSLIITSLIICNFNNLLFYSLWVFVYYFVIFAIQYDNAELRRQKIENINNK